MQPLRHQQLLRQGLGEIAFGAFECADEAFDQLRNGVPIIDIARRQAKSQQFALIINDQVELKTREPADRGLAAGGAPGKHLVLVDASIMADRKRRRVDETDAGASAQLGMQIGHQWHQDRGHQLDEALIANLRGKLVVQVALDVLDVIRASRSDSGTDGTGS